jgi:hypothetical protein
MRPMIRRSGATRRGRESLIVGTDKKAGLYVYGLDGKVRDFAAAGRLNNVDLIDMGAAGVIVVASDRNDEAQAKLQVWRLDTAAAKLQPLGAVTGGAGEAYGVCLLRDAGGLTAFSVLKHGAIVQVRIATGRIVCMRPRPRAASPIRARARSMWARKTGASGRSMRARIAPPKPRWSPRSTARTCSTMWKAWR